MSDNSSICQTLKHSLTKSPCTRKKLAYCLLQITKKVKLFTIIKNVGVFLRMANFNIISI